MSDSGSALSVLIALVGGAACAVSILAARRALLLLSLLVQFVCAALLLNALPPALAVAYGIVGLCACAILAATPIDPGTTAEAQPAGIPSGMPFRLVAVLLVGIASIMLGRAALGTGGAVLPGAPLGAGLLLGLGLLQVGLSEEPLRVGSGLMSILGGFEIGYTTVESAIALHGLIIGLPLLIALVVAYLAVLPSAEKGGAP